MAQQDVFISYSRKDTPIADRVCQAFDKAGITYFIDRQGIGGGMEFPKVLSEAILDCKIFLYLGSANSYKSRFTSSEVTYAFNKKPKEQILPYIIDGSSLPAELEFVFSCINIRNIKEHPIETTLVEDVIEMLGKQAEHQNSSYARKKTGFFIAIAAGVVSICLAADLYCMLTRRGQELTLDNVTEQVVEPKDPDLIFNTEEEVRSFLSGMAFESPQGLWFSFNDDLTMEFWEKGNSEGRPIEKFIIKDIKGDSAVLEIIYLINGQEYKFINILECIDGKVSININGGGYKYYAINTH